MVLGSWGRSAERGRGGCSLPAQASILRGVRDRKQTQDFYLKIINKSSEEKGFSQLLARENTSCLSLAGKKGEKWKSLKFGRANPSTAAAWESTHLSNAKLALKHLEDKSKTMQINRIYFRLQVGGGVKKEKKKKGQLSKGRQVQAPYNFVKAKEPSS